MNGAGGLGRIRVLLETDDLAFVQSPHVSELGVERHAGSFICSFVATQHDDRVTRVEELCGYGLELIPLRSKTEKDTFSNGGWPNVGIAVRVRKTLGLVPDDGGIHVG